MERTRLDVGAVVSANGTKNDFVFFLCDKESNKGIPINLSAQQVYSVLANFDKIDERDITTQQFITNLLGRFYIELLEVQIFKDKERELFMAKLLFFDGESEIFDIANAVDGAILAKKFEAPIYISTEDMLEFSVDVASMGFANSSAPIGSDNYNIVELEEMLNNAVEQEDYESAAKIKKEISKLTK